MKKALIIGASGLLSILLMSSSFAGEKRSENSIASEKAANYNVIHEESSIVWEGGKVTGGSHTGTLDIKESSLNIQEGNLVGGSFVMDMNSIRNTDLKEGSAAKLVGHLKSDDFFGVSNYPTSSFIITDVKKSSNPDEFKVTGDLTIKSTTLPVTFPVNLTWEGEKAIARAKISVDRANYDVRYGSGKFFDGLGDKTIKDEFTLDVTIISSK